MLKTIKSLMMEGIVEGGTMLDLGCGSGKDALAASENGFEVTAVDKKPIPELPLIHFIESKIEDFDIEANKYDFIYADNSLPFLLKDDVKKVLLDATQKLKGGGVVYFSLFGEHDSWVNDKQMNFWKKEEVNEFVGSLELFLYRKTEEEGYAAAMNGDTKYWHIFRFILKKQPITSNEVSKI